MSSAAYTTPTHIQNRIDRIPAEQRERDMADYDALRRVHRLMLHDPIDGFPNQAVLSEIETYLIQIEDLYNL
jgi:hypothetical protein